MSTLIALSHRGRRKRCDARCYNGHGRRCRCICGGRNHGAGMVQAGQNTRDMAHDLEERARDEGARLVLSPGLGLELPAPVL